MPKPQLYLQVRDRIQELTRQEKLLPGDQLPSEAILSQTLDVSRNTVRDALMSLEQDGVVIRRHGLGTFMAAAPHALKTSLNQILPIPELIAAAGFTPRVKDLKITPIAGPSDAHLTLLVSPSEPLQSVSLLYLADKRPAIYITYWLIPPMLAENIQWSEFDGHMLNFIERALTARIHHTFARIHAVTASKELANKLAVKPATPLLKMMHVAFGPDGQPIYCSTSYQNSELLEVSVLRQRK
jgi:GntR family transcriptional regulator